MKKTCEICKVEYKTNRNESKFCSRKCYHESTLNGEFVECTICAKAVWQTPFYLKQYKKTFCSNECKHAGQIKRLKKPCELCGEEMLLSPHWFKKRKYCSNKCVGLASRTKDIPESERKIQKKLVKSKVNNNWSGDGVSYRAIHKYIKRRKEKPIKCELCGETPTHKTGLDLANISQEYKRDIDDWEWLCRRCHMTKDGRLEKFKNLSRGGDKDVVM